MTAKNSANPNTRKTSSMRLMFWSFLIIVGLLLVVEHRVHIFTNPSWIWIALIVACPLLHVFGHGGHGKHADKHSTDHKQENAAESVNKDIEHNDQPKH